MKMDKTKVKELLKSEKVSSGALTAVIIVLVIAFNIAIFALSGILGLSYTTPEKDKVVLTGNTDPLFADAVSQNKKVKINFCFPAREDLVNHQTGAFVLKTAEQFAAAYPGFIEIDYVNLITRKNGKGEDISEKIKAWQGSEEDGTFNHLAKGSVVFECGDNFKVVTDTYTSAAFADFYILDSSGRAIAYNGESFMAAIIHWVTVKDHPKAYFTVGHSEQFDRSFLTLLTSAGYVVDTVNLKKEPVPQDAGLLIISNPLSDFETAAEGVSLVTEAERLESYVKGGGNLYVALDPYVNKLTVLEGFLEKNGIAFSETDLGATVVRNMVKDSTNAITTDGFTLVAELADNEIADSINKTLSSYSDGHVIVREAAALELSGSAVPVLVATSSSSLEADGKKVDSKGSYAVAACAKVKGDRDKVGSIFVVSSIYAAVSDALVSNGYSNTDFYYSLFENFYGRSGMPYGCDVMLSDTMTLENLTMGRARLYTAVILAVPAIVAVLGTAVVIKRKNR